MGSGALRGQRWLLMAVEAGGSCALDGPGLVDRLPAAVRVVGQCPGG